MVRGYLLAPAGKVNATATEKRFVGVLRAICRENVLKLEEGLPCDVPVDQSSVQPKVSGQCLPLPGGERGSSWVRRVFVMLSVSKLVAIVPSER